MKLKGHKKYTREHSLFFSVAKKPLFKCISPLSANLTMTQRRRVMQGQQQTMRSNNKSVRGLTANNRSVRNGHAVTAAAAASSVSRVSKPSWLRIVASPLTDETKA